MIGSHTMNLNICRDEYTKLGEIRLHKSIEEGQNSTEDECHTMSYT